MKQFWKVALCLLVLSGTATAQGGAVTVSIGNTVGNVGSIVEVPVYLTEGTAEPTVLILFVRYDPAKLRPYSEYYQFILTDALGNPATDSNGNAITVESAVRPEPALTNADKIVETGVMPDGTQTGALPEGAFSIGIFGFDFEQDPIPGGKLFTVAFEVLAGASPSETLVIEGVGSDDPIQVVDDSGVGDPIVVEAYSNAASADTPPLSIDVNPVDGWIALGCTPAETPANVSASQNRGDGVLVQWDAIAELDAEYRVYRSTQADVNTAMPLGDSWTTETEFLDVSALVPINAGGCAPEYVPTEYYYWVTARTNNCESAFQSLGTVGYRTNAKALQAASARGMIILWAAIVLGLTFGGGARRRKA